MGVIVLLSPKIDYITPLFPKAKMFFFFKDAFVTLYWPPAFVPSPHPYNECLCLFLLQNKSGRASNFQVLKELKCKIVSNIVKQN